MNLKILLWDVMFDFNLGFAIRDIYMLGDGLLDLIVFDPRHLLTEKVESVTRYSGFAIEHYTALSTIDGEDSALDFVQSYPNRIVCAVPEEEANDVNDFEFYPDDLIVFGNEHRGIPDSVTELAHKKIVIPMYGSVYPRPDFGGKVSNVGTQRCLSLHTSISIILYVAVRNLTQFENWRTTFNTQMKFDKKSMSNYPATSRCTTFTG